MENTEQLPQDFARCFACISAECDLMDRNSIRENGYIEGKAEGRAEGRAEGKTETNHTNALEMLKLGLSPNVIRQVTGLSLEDIEALRQH